MNADVSTVDDDEGNVEAFVKDHRLVSEALATGKRLKVGRKFWAKLAHEIHWFAQIVAVAKGESMIIHHNHRIEDCSLPEMRGYKVIEHSQIGSHIWDPARVRLDANVLGDGLMYFNYNFMEVFIKKPYLIPDRWHSKLIVFSGTKFRHTQTGEEKWWGLSISDQKNILTVTVRALQIGNFAVNYFPRYQT